MSSKDLKVSLIVPVFCERVQLTESLDALDDFVAGFAVGSELIVVDDGSSDETAAFAEQEARSRSAARMTVARRAHLGKGAAIRAGVELASSPVVAVCDVDLSTPLEELDRVIRAARDRNCLAVGSRDAHGARVLQSQSRAREWLGRQYNRLLRATVIDDVRDTQCGAKAAPAAVWAAILPWSAEVGMAWDVEVVAIAQRLDIEVAEVPIEWHHDTRSRVKPFRDGMALLTALPRIARAARAAGRAEESTRPDSAPRPPRAPVDVRR